MPKRPPPAKKRAPPKQFFRQWREQLGLTQDRALERLEHWSQSKLSRIESGATVFNAHDVADLANAYGVSEWSLTNVNPEKDGDVVDLMKLIQDKDLAVIRAIVEGLPSKTGTGDR